MNLGLSMNRLLVTTPSAVLSTVDYSLLNIKIGQDTNLALFSSYARISIHLQTEVQVSLQASLGPFHRFQRKEQ